MAEQRRSLGAMDDLGLENALRDLGPALAYPSPVAGPSDIASRVRQQIVAAPPARRRSGLLGWIGGRPLRRSLLVAVAALLIVAAIAGAVGLGVPGIRIFFGGPTPPAATTTATAPASPAPASPASSTTATPTAGVSTPVGITMGLGTEVTLEEAARIAGLDLVLPPDPAIGPPDATYVVANRAALVWGARPGLPADPDNGVGLLVSEFRGSIDQGYFSKTLESNAQVTPITVNGNAGYWISGPPHFFFYIDPSGKPVDDTHRIVGDTLLWSDGDVTYRIESQLTKDEVIRLAESLR